jgi:hypothetical protein
VLQRNTVNGADIGFPYDPSSQLLLPVPG